MTSTALVKQPHIYGAAPLRYRQGTVVSSDGSPPVWAPEMAHDPAYHYTLREWQRDVYRWASITKVYAERQGPLVALAVGGAARTLVDEIPEQVLQYGAQADFQDGRGNILRPGIDVVLYALHKRFPDNLEAEMIRVCLEFFAFRPQAGEKVQIIFFRFDAMLDRANKLAELGITWQFKAWMILALLRLPPRKWADYLKEMGHRFPRTEAEYQAMQQAIIRERVFMTDVGQLGANAQSAGSHVGYAEGTFAVLGNDPLPLYMCLGSPSEDDVPAFPTVSKDSGSNVGAPSLGHVQENLDLTLYNWEGVDDASDSEVSNEETWLAENAHDPYTPERLANEQQLAAGNGKYLKDLFWARRVATRRFRAAKGKFGPRSRFKIRKMSKRVTKWGPPARSVHIIAPGDKSRICSN